MRGSCDKRTPSRVNAYVHKKIVQPAMLYWTETVSMTSSNVKKLDVTKMKMCRWACGHTLRDFVRNDNINERLHAQNIM